MSPRQGRSPVGREPLTACGGSRARLPRGPRFSPGRLRAVFAFFHDPVQGVQDRLQVPLRFDLRDLLLKGPQHSDARQAHRDHTCRTGKILANFCLHTHIPTSLRVALIIKDRKYPTDSRARPAPRGAPARAQRGAADAHGRGALWRDHGYFNTRTQPWPFAFPAAGQSTVAHGYVSPLRPGHWGRGEDRSPRGSRHTPQPRPREQGHAGERTAATAARSHRGQR